MFWSKKKKTDDKKPPASNIEAVRAQALANMRAARENIGEETLDRIAAAMHKKQTSLTEQAKSQIKSYDINDLAKELRYLIEDDKSIR